MFPTGVAGAALLLLRVAVAAMLASNILRADRPMNHLWVATGMGLLQLTLCLGLFTPLMCITCCIIEITTLIGLKDTVFIPLLALILVTAALGMLGPGAYSLDARMFGRKLVISSSEKTMRGE